MLEILFLTISPKIGADYDFINESYEKFQQLGSVEAVTQGVVDQIRVIDGGEGYRIDDTINFDLSESVFGLRGEVSRIKGAGISSIKRLKKCELSIWNGIMKKFLHIILIQD